MADVATVAGVSHQTVSRVLNDHPNVRSSTRERVLAAISKLGYRRNSSARALVTRRTNTLGVVALDTTLYGPASTLLGIEWAARNAGYFISIVSLKKITRSGVDEALEYLAEQSVDGFIVIAPHRWAATALAGLPAQLPAVAVEGGEAGALPAVAVDQVAGASLATQHLLDQGHETVWHVAGPTDWLESEGRVRGWRQTLEAAQVPQPELIYGDWSPRSGHEAGRVLMDKLRNRATDPTGTSDPPLSAVFVANDQMALGLLRACHEAGVRVPEDISVVGFDDIPEAEFFSPPLTTVRQDFAEVGRRSLDMLLAQIEGGAKRGEEHRAIVAPEFIVRESTRVHQDVS
ncbi:LacI family DNA-binding transcriptional regulator [Actinobacteria bacterium YIM 96077]|uniref:LacI family transcriptional regulator n=2 Tax=Phytoactinopolyspora halophila TaxID=1981511 RepID=A0A329R1Z7_9ACTN|nr:LacI family DNA-binding transcriptional regulator [Actinobacteria bacterium YIM 96077]RAW18196.1 LacI family transcriptional regulator [Phytoactinopolyspora halophila]